MTSPPGHSSPFRTHRVPAAPEAATRLRYSIATVAVPGQQVLDVPETELDRRGIGVCRYSSAACALLGIGADPPDGVLVPTDLPGMPVLEFVRTVTTRTSIPVWVGMTSRPASQTLGFHALEHGARGLMPLPVPLRRISEAVLGLEPAPAEELICGPVVLHPQSMRVSVEGQPVHLAPREFQVLEYLMRHAPRVISLDELTGHCSGHSTNPREGLRMTLLRARRKLAQATAGRGPAIETVRGVGYRMASCADPGPSAGEGCASGALGR